MFVSVEDERLPNECLRSFSISKGEGNVYFDSGFWREPFHVLQKMCLRFNECFFLSYFFFFQTWCAITGVPGNTSWSRFSQDAAAALGRKPAWAAWIHFCNETVLPVASLRARWATTAQTPEGGAPSTSGPTRSFHSAKHSSSGLTHICTQALSLNTKK